MTPTEKAAYNGPRDYIVQTAGAKMPQSCWGIYRRVAVLEVLPGVTRASMISDRAINVLRVVATWEACNVGKTRRCAYQVALADAEALASQLRYDAHTVPFRADLTTALAAEKNATPTL
jgi:hypothetical protein